MCITKDEEVKKAILEAAKRVFQKWGLHKTTMEDIAHEAGKGKSTLYYYFKSKEEIFETVVLIVFSEIVEKAKSGTIEIKTAKAKLKKYIAIILGEFKKSANIYPIIDGEIRGNKDFIDSVRRKLDVLEESIISEILRIGVETGEFRTLKDHEIPKAANVIVGLIRGMELYLFLDNNDEEKVDLATRIIAAEF